MVSVQSWPIASKVKDSAARTMSPSKKWSDHFTMLDQVIACSGALKRLREKRPD